jgi:hypothetical protein
MSDQAQTKSVESQGENTPREEETVYRKGRTWNGPTTLQPILQQQRQPAEDARSQAQAQQQHGLLKYATFVSR